MISFDSSETATMECSHGSQTWNVLGSLYFCKVTKGITITSLDTAYLNSTTGSHQSGYNNDNVNYFYIESVTISYFPRGLDAIFKNLKGIWFYKNGLKEIHQSDLKPFSKLIEFLIHGGNQLEILEEGLFDFNPDLEYINLHINKITHIDPKVFDSLTKLRHLYLNSNTCFSKGAYDRTAVQNLIKEVKTMCNNSDYSILDQKLKFLESESKSLSFNDFKVELENLESKINASKFINFYQTKLRNLKIVLDEKSHEVKNCSTLKVKFLNFITNLKNLTSQVSNEIENVSEESNNEATVNQQCMSLNDSFVNINNNVEKVNEKIVNLSENILNVNQTVAKIEEQVSSLKESFINFNKEATTEFKDNFVKNNENYAELNEKVENVKKAVESVDKKLVELRVSINNIRTSAIENDESESASTHDVIKEAITKAVEKIEKNLMDKMDENLKEINKKVQESEKRFNERSAKIMKALKVIFDVSDMALNYSLQ